MPRTTADAPPAEPPPADPSPAETPRTDPPGAATGFFAWIERLELPRRPGWIGGVCAGIASRLGVDVLLVRGIAVVLAVLGGPVALLYALAWFLLPDEHGTIHARELGRGRVTRAVPGIAGVFLLSFIPLAQGFWFAGAFYWGEPGWAGVALRVFWTAVLIAAAIAFVVWLASRASSPDVTTTPATTDDSPATVPTFPAVAAGAAPAAVAEPAGQPAPPPTPGEPPPPPADASAEELAAWKQSQDEWQRQRAQWAAEQRRTDQERQRAEARARSAAALEASLERARVRRITRPHAPAGVVFLVLGVALVAAALAALVAQGAPATRGAEWVIGAGVLTLLLGLGIAIVGFGRRRSGCLSFLGLLSLVALLAATLLPADRQVLPPGANQGIEGTRDGRYAQLAGTTSMYVVDRGPSGGAPPVVDLWQLTGGVQIELEEGATVRIDLVTDAARQMISIEEIGPGRSSYYEVTEGALEATIGAGEPDLVLRVWVGGGVWVNVRAAWTPDAVVQFDPEPDTRAHWGEAPEPIEPTPVPTVTEGATP